MAGRDRAFRGITYIKKTVPTGGSYWVNPGKPDQGYLVDPTTNPGAIPYPIEYIDWILRPTAPTASSIRSARTGKEAREIGGQALNGKIGLAYGQVRIAPSVFFGPRQHLYDPTAITVGYGLSHGPCDSLVSTIFPNGKPDWVMRGCTQSGAYGQVAYNDTFFPGDLNPTDPATQFENALVGLAIPHANIERYPGLCYVAATLRSYENCWQGTPGPYPMPLFVIKGRKVRNYDTGLDEWTDNPAYCTADYITSKRYGRGVKVNEASVIEAAAYCDETFTNTATAEVMKKHTLNYFMLRAANHKAHMDALRAHFRCSFIERGGEIIFLIDKDKPTALAFDETHAVPVSIERMGGSGIPNTVTVKSPDPANNYEMAPQVAKTAGAEAGTEIPKEANYELEGIDKPVRSASEAFYLLNTRLNNLRVVLRAVHPEARRLEPLDIIEYTTASFGLSSFKLRVLRVTRTSDGTAYMIECAGHDPAVYSFQARAIESYPLPTVPSALLTPEPIGWIYRDPLNGTLWWDTPPVRQRTQYGAGYWTNTGADIWTPANLNNGLVIDYAARFTTGGYIDFDAGADVEIPEWELYYGNSGNGALSQIDGSPDGVTWFSVFSPVSWQGHQDASLGYQRVICDPATPHNYRYWRLYFGASADRIREIQPVTYTGAWVWGKGYRLKGWKPTGTPIPTALPNIDKVEDIFVQPTQDEPIKEVDWSQEFNNFSPLDNSGSFGGETWLKVYTIAQNDVISTDFNEYHTFHSASATGAGALGVQQLYQTPGKSVYGPSSNGEVIGDYALPWIANHLIITGTHTGVNLTGMAEVQDGRLVTITNAQTADLQISGLTGSTAANQFWFNGHPTIPGGNIFYLAPEASATFVYDGNAQKWRLVDDVYTGSSSNINSFYGSRQFLTYSGDIALTLATATAAGAAESLISSGGFGVGTAYKSTTRYRAIGAGGTVAAGWSVGMIGDSVFRIRENGPAGGYASDVFTAERIVGTVGIGIAADAANRLLVNGTIKSTSFHDINDGTRRMVIGGDATGNYINGVSGHSLRFGTNNADRMTISSAGAYVGIGLAPSTSYSLTLAGSMRTATGIDIDATTTRIVIGPDYVRGVTNNAIGFGANNADKMWLAANGDLGIGVTPSYALHIKRTSLDIYAMVESTGTAYAATMRFKNSTRDWIVGLFGTDAFTVRDQTGGTVPFSISTTGAVSLITGITIGSASAPHITLTGNASTPTYILVNAAPIGGKAWRVGHTGAGSNTTFDIYNQTDSIMPVSIAATGGVTLIAGLVAASGTIQGKRFAHVNLDIAVSNAMQPVAQLAIGGYGHIRVTAGTGLAAGFTIRGLASGSGGDRVTIFNNSGFTITFPHNDGTAAAADRIWNRTGANVLLENGGALEFMYDFANSKWIVIGR